MRIIIFFLTFFLKKNCMSNSIFVDNIQSIDISLHVQEYEDSETKLNMQEYEDCGIYYHHKAKQGTMEWLLAREKVDITASNVAKAIGKSEYIQRDVFIYNKKNKIKDIFSDFQKKCMLDGTIYEPYVRERYETNCNIEIYEGYECYNEETKCYIKTYEETKKIKVKELGLCINKKDLKLGGSTDGVVFEIQMDEFGMMIVEKELDLVIEIKCPQYMYESLLLYIKMRGFVSIKNFIKPDHYYQMQACMFVLGKKKCHYVIYPINKNPEKKIYVFVVFFDEKEWYHEITPLLHQYYIDLAEKINIKYNSIESYFIFPYKKHKEKN